MLAIAALHALTNAWTCLCFHRGSSPHICSNTCHHSTQLLQTGGVHHEPCTPAAADCTMRFVCVVNVCPCLCPLCWSSWQQATACSSKAAATAAAAAANCADALCTPELTCAWCLSTRSPQPNHQYHEQHRQHHTASCRHQPREATDHTAASRSC